MKKIKITLILMIIIPSIYISQNYDIYNEKGKYQGSIYKGTDGSNPYIFLQTNPEYAKTDPQWVRIPVEEQKIANENAVKRYNANIKRYNENINEAIEFNKEVAKQLSIWVDENRIDREKAYKLFEEYSINLDDIDETSSIKIQYKKSSFNMLQTFKPF